MEQEKRMRREIANSNERRRMESINAGFQTLKALLPRRDGEKISKASILQQTAEFITHLQREKVLLTQQIGQYKVIVKAAGLPSPTPLAPSQDCANADVVTTEDIPLKKRRKYEAISTDSSDEGLGGMTSDTEVQVKKSKILRFTPTSSSSSTSDACCQTVEEQQQQSNSNHQQQQQQKWSSTGQQQQINAAAMVSQDKMWESELLQRQLIEIRLALDRERRMRSLLEEQMRNVEISRLQSLSRLSLLDYPAAAAAAFQSLLPHAAAAASYNNLLMPPNSAATANNMAAAGVSPCFNDSQQQPGLMNNNNNNHPNIIASSATAANTAAAAAAASNRISPCSVAPKTSLSPPPPVAPPRGGPLNFPANITAQQQQHRSSFTPGHVIHQSSQYNSVVVPANQNSAATQQQSRQSLEAIVEAIRHLEGDQLFVEDSGKWSSVGGRLSNGGHVVGRLLHQQQQPADHNSHHLVYGSGEQCVPQEPYALYRKENC